MPSGDDSILVERLGIVVELHVRVEVDPCSFRFLYLCDGRGAEVPQEGVVLGVDFQILFVELERIAHR